MAIRNYLDGLLDYFDDNLQEIKKSTESLTKKRNAYCMRCGRLHGYYTFSRKQTMYLLWCETCGTAMHHRLKKE